MTLSFDETEKGKWKQPAGEKDLFSSFFLCQILGSIANGDETSSNMEPPLCGNHKTP